jgi:broad specificity phosphatase PhoE
MIIKLVRHAESKSNAGEIDPSEVGDFRIPLTERGLVQARDLGSVLGADFVRDAVIYRSPFRRTRQTLDQILAGAGLVDEEGKPLVTIHEDSRLREVDLGTRSYLEQEPLRKRFGWFYYRFEGGESPADCFDRASSFLDSLWRQLKRHRQQKLSINASNSSLYAVLSWPYRFVRWLFNRDAPNVLIVTHGMTIRCLVMRFFHLSVEQFNALHNPHNCDVITIAPKRALKDPMYTYGNWGVTGLRVRRAGEDDLTEPDETDS